MGVSLDIYRQSIGAHNLKIRIRIQKIITLRNNQKKNGFQNFNSSSRPNSFEICVMFLLYSLLYLVTDLSLQTKSYKLEVGRSIYNQSVYNQSIYKPTLVTDHGLSQNVSSSLITSLHSSQENIAVTHLNWGSNLSINKQAHILYGNRRNLGYKYFSWNCDRGLLSRNKIEDIRQFAARHKPHFMGISEVDLRRNENNANESSTNEFSTEQVQEVFKIQGYRLLFPSSWLTHNKARIIVFVNEEIKAKVKDALPGEDYLQHVALEVGFGKSKTHIVDFYYREWKSCITGENSKAAQEKEFGKLTEIWRRLASEDKDFIALGDTNLCAKKFDDQNYIHKDLVDIFKDFLIEESCYQIVDDFTRIRMVNGEVQRSCLDHITVNCVDKISKPEILGVGPSDHLGLLVTKKTRELRTSARTTKKRVYKNFDRNDFLTDMKVAQDTGLFEEMHQTEDIEVAAEIFTEVFTKVLDKHAPLKVIQNRNNYVPYISDEIQAMMKQRNIMKKSAAETGNTEVFEDYKKIRNEVSTKLKTAKSDYYRSKFQDESINSKDLWGKAYQVLGKNRSDFPSQMLFGNKLLSKPIQIADAMNEFFVDKIAKLKKEPRNEEDPLRELKRYLASKPPPVEGFKFKELQDHEILKLIKRLKGKKSSGLDWICGYSLKIAAELLLPQLKVLVNLSFRHGKFYSKWKKTKVLPGFKNKGSKFDAKFYRPISNLSEVSKIPEMAAHDQLYQYLNENSLLHPDHHGFLKHRSTTTALQQLMDIWLKAAENGKISAAVLLDLSAGFDVINHQILLAKLKEYGLDNLALSWFEDYLHQRSQCVQIESKLSSFLDVLWGVPQGSILGPLLFVIFINELPDTIKVERPEEEASNDATEDDHVVVYADDNTPTASAEDPYQLQSRIQAIADIVTNWFSRNDMLVSSEKTKLLFIGTQQNRSHKIEGPNFTPILNVCGEDVSVTKSEKLLGLVINDTMTWKTHLYGDGDENLGLLKILSKRVGMLKKLRKCIPSVKFKQVLAGLFTSKLIYGMCVWTGVWGIPGQTGEETRTSITKKDMYRLQTLQNKTLRLVNWADRSTPTMQQLGSTGSFSVHQLGAYLTLIQVFKIRESKQPEYHYKRLFGENEPAVNVRSSDFPQVRVNFKLALSRGSFFYQGCRLWSALPGNIKLLTKPESFKKKCKQWVKMNVKIKP